MSYKRNKDKKKRRIPIIKDPYKNMCYQCEEMFYEDGERHCMLGNDCNKGGCNDKTR